MAKFHIAKSGKPAACKADAKACPLGADTPHGDFDSAEAANAWAEEFHAKNSGGTFVNKRKAPKVYEIASTELAQLQPGESIDDEDMGELVEEMLTEDGHIEDRFLDDNYGFPRVLGKIKFEKNSDGSFKLTGPKDALEEWAEEDPNEIEIAQVKDEPQVNDSLLPKDLESFEGTPFERVAIAEVRSISIPKDSRGRSFRDAPTNTIVDAEKVSPEDWNKLADEAQAEFLKVEELRRGFAEEARKSNAYFKPTSKDSREADLKARQLNALAINARNAAYIASEKKLPNGDVIKPGEILVPATFDNKGNLLGYGASGNATVNGEEVKFSLSSSRKGNTTLGVVAVKGVIEKGQVKANTQNIEDARVLNGSTAANVAGANPMDVSSEEPWRLGDHTYHGVSQGQPYFSYKTLRDANGFDSIIAEY